jgi:flagella basal body P-ring formation protein FlgA
MFLLIFLPFLLFAGVIEGNITEVYKQTYKDIKIENLSLQYYGKKIKDIKFIDTSNINPKQAQGMVKINNLRFVYFKLTAKIKALKSKKVINRGEKVDKKNAVVSWIPLKYLYKIPLKDIPKNSVAKMYIPNNHLIYQYMLTTPYLVKRGSIIKVISESGGIEITFQGIAMQNGEEGDFIKVKDKNKNVYEVKIDKNGNGIL